MLVSLAFALVSPVPAAALPEDSGSLTFTSSTKTATLDGSSVSFDLYIPKVSAPAPIVAVAHGFQRSKANVANWGKELAKRGYVAACPSFPGLIAANHAKNAKILSALLAWMVAEGSKAGSPLYGLVDSTRRGVMGHSAGGLASLLAAAGDATIDVVVGLDAVDVSTLGVTAAPTVKVPVTLIRAESGTCNSNGNFSSVFAVLTAPRMSLTVKNANHCDPESPSDALCGLLCGGSVDSKRHSLFRRYAFATLDHVLLCDPQMAAWLGGSQALSDTGIKDIKSAQYPPAKASCASSPDSGIKEAGAGKDLGTSDKPSIQDGAKTDGVATPDRAISKDARSDLAVEPEGHEADGCALAGAPNPKSALVLFLVAAFGVIWRLAPGRLRSPRTPV